MKGKGNLVAVIAFLLFAVLMTRHVDHPKPTPTYPHVTIPAVSNVVLPNEVPAFTTSGGQTCEEVRTPNGQWVTPYYPVDGGRVTLETNRYSRYCVGTTAHHRKGR